MEDGISKERTEILNSLLEKRITFKQATALLRQLKIVKEKKVKAYNEISPA